MEILIVFREHSNGASSLRVGPDGRLYASQPARKRIVSYGAGGEEKMVAQNVEASDITLTAARRFTSRMRRSQNARLHRRRRQTAHRLPGGEMALPSAVALSPDQAMLIVTDAQSRFSWSFQIAADGSLINGEPFYRLRDAGE